MKRGSLRNSHVVIVGAILTVILGIVAFLRMPVDVFPQLDIPVAVTSLRRIFPATPEAVVDTDFGEPASYVSDDSQTYQRENDLIFTTMLKLYDLIPRISIAIIHYIGAIG